MNLKLETHELDAASVDISTLKCGEKFTMSGDPENTEYVYCGFHPMPGYRIYFFKTVESFPVRQYGDFPYQKTGLEQKAFQTPDKLQVIKI